MWSQCECGPDGLTSSRSSELNPTISLNSLDGPHSSFSFLPSPVLLNIGFRANPAEKTWSPKWKQAKVLVVASFSGSPLAHPSGTLQGTALVVFENC